MFDLTNVVFQPRNFSKQELYETYWKSYQELYSLKSIARNIWYNVRISDNPARELLSSAFVQAYYRKKVYSRDHPLVGGIGMRN
jgi:hypothetical protein